MGDEVEGGRLVTGFACDAPIDPTDRAVVEDAVRRFLPKARICACDGHNWVADRWSKGAWLVLPPGWVSGGVRDRLEDREGRVAFAGSDIVLEGGGWIEGAIRSGRKAAASVLGLLRV